LTLNTSTVNGKQLGNGRQRRNSDGANNNGNGGSAFGGGIYKPPPSLSRQLHPYTRANRAASSGVDINGRIIQRERAGIVDAAAKRRSAALPLLLAPSELPPLPPVPSCCR